MWTEKKFSVNHTATRMGREDWNSRIQNCRQPIFGWRVRWVRGQTNVFKFTFHAKKVFSKYFNDPTRRNLERMKNNNQFIMASHMWPGKRQQGCNTSPAVAVPGVCPPTTTTTVVRSASFLHESHYQLTTYFITSPPTCVTIMSSIAARYVSRGTKRTNYAQLNGHISDTPVLLPPRRI